MAMKKSLLADKAYEILCDKILCFALPPGQIISDYVLSQELGMSRTPIREALVRLQQEGLLEFTNYDKMIISNANITDIEEIYQARMAIECKAADIIFNRGGLTPEQLLKIKDINNHLSKYIEAKDYKMNFETDDIFHQSIMEFAGNHRLLDFSHLLRKQIMRARYLTIVTPDWFGNTIAEHVQIQQALYENNLEQAKNYINIHMENSIKNYRAILGSLPANGMLAIANMLYNGQDNAERSCSV